MQIRKTEYFPLKDFVWNFDLSVNFQRWGRKEVVQPANWNKPSHITMLQLIIFFVDNTVFSYHGVECVK